MNHPLLEKVYQHPLLSSKDLSAIMAAHQQITYAKGDFVLKEGQIAQSYAIIESGLMRSFVHDFNGNEITTNFFDSHDISIEVSSLFQRIPTSENIQVLTDCVCWEISFDVFQALFHSIKGFSEWGRAWMSNELFMLKQRSVTMLTKSATERYLELLEQKPQIIQQASLKYVASYLGITDTSLSRIRKEIFK